MTLVIANLIPIVGVLFWGWELFDVVFVYWLESLIVGFFTMLKFLPIAHASSVFLIPFFWLHYGAFVCVHFLFIYATFGGGEEMSFFIPPLDLLLTFIAGVVFGFVALFISHGHSFIANFMRRREYLHLTSERVMQAPYKRIIVLQLTIMMGAFGVMEFNWPVASMAAVIVVKTLFDIYTHYSAHSIHGAK